MLLTAPPPVRKCQGHRSVGKGRDVGDWPMAAPDVCNGTSAVGESRHHDLARPLVNQLNLG